MCHHLENLSTSITQYFPNDQCTISQTYTYVKKKVPLKMQNRPVDFNKVQWLIDMFSDLIT